MQTRTAGPGHQKFMSDLCALNARYEGNGIPKLEQIALMAQRDSGFTTQELLQSVAGNIATGNRERAGGGRLI